MGSQLELEVMNFSFLYWPERGYGEWFLVINDVLLPGALISNKNANFRWRTPSCEVPTLEHQITSSLEEAKYDLLQKYSQITKEKSNK
jgi:hypothetical protein